MKIISLDELNLRDFKAKTFRFSPGGLDTDVFGANQTGKTTLADAWQWLLFDKDSLGRADFEIKNLDAEGNQKHNLEHSVEGIINLDEQRAMALKKVYHEIWSKKRGSPKATFSGHTTDYFIDGVPIQKKEYQAKVAEIAGDESIFRLLTSPHTFPALHWQKQREILLDVCGDMADADVIALNPELEPLGIILSNRSIDDHRKVVTSRRSEINRELERIPVRIDEQRRSVPDVSGLDRAGIEAEIKVMEKDINYLKLKQQGVDTGGTIAELTKKLAILNTEIQALENKHSSEYMHEANKRNNAVEELSSEIQRDERQIRSKSADIESLSKKVSHIEDDLALLRRQWNVEDAKDFGEFQDTVTDTCPTCKQSLPADEVQAARDKARADYDKELAAFNHEKAEAKARINERGKELRDKTQAQVKSEIESLKISMEALEAGLPGKKAKLLTLTEDRDNIIKLKNDYSSVPGYTEKIKARQTVQDSIETEKEDRKAEVETLKNQIAVKDTALSALKADINKFIRGETAEQRIEELKDEEKKLAEEFERLEKELYLLDEFIKAKVSMLTVKINTGFELARFKLFNVLVNGGIEECCEITGGGVPFNSGLNSAMRINCGLDIIRTLQGHYGIRAPIWIDNRESVTRIPSMDCQIISLFVSAEDKNLRIETAK